MPRIPYQSEVSALSGRSNSPLQRGGSDPAAFGAPVGQALESLGRQGMASSAEIYNADQEERERKRREEEAISVAGFNWAEQELAIRNRVGPQAEGYLDEVREGYVAAVEDYISGIEDDKVRSGVRSRLMSNLPNVASGAAEYEYKARAEYSSLQANDAVNTLQNRIALDPAMYDVYRDQGMSVIDSLPNTTAGYREGLKQSWKYDSAKRRFDGMTQNVRSVEDIDAIAAELRGESGREWQEEMLPSDYESLNNQLGTMRKQFETQFRANAKALVTDLGSRQKDNPYNLLNPQEVQATQMAVKQAQDPAISTDMARVMRNNEITRTEGKLPPAEMRARIGATDGSPGFAYPGLPEEVSTAIADASEAFGVSQQYLGATAHREYGSELAKARKKSKDTGAEVKVDYDAPTGILDESGKPTSSARGLFQFTKDTWLQVIKDPAVSAVMGVDLGLSDDELLALRGDEYLSTLAAAAFANKNRKYLEGELGRPVSDAELYMAHFMGAGGAASFLTAYKADPNQTAATLMPSAAKANKPVFYEGSKPRTVGEVYENIARSFTVAPDIVEYGDNQHRKALLERAEKTLSTYPLQHALDTGSHAITPLDQEGGFRARGTQAKAVAEYYSIPSRDMKPFTQDEEAFIKRTVGEGTVEENLAVMANIRDMGEEMSRAALKQIGEKDASFAHAAGLFTAGNISVAEDIIRGRKRMQDNPAIEEQIGATKTQLNDEFVSYTGSSLNELKPYQRQAVQDAAMALYVQRMATGGGNITRFDRAAYQSAIQDSVGAATGAQAIDTVNGVKTYLPPGITGEQMESAVYNMGIDDWTAMSDTGEPPRYVDGGIADPDDIKSEVVLKAIGDGKYRVALDDGSLLVTGKRTPDGRMEAFVLVPDPERIKKVAARAKPSWWSR